MIIHSFISEILSNNIVHNITMLRVNNTVNVMTLHACTYVSMCVALIVTGNMMIYVVFIVIGGQQFMPYGSPQIVAPSQTALVNNPWSRTAVQSAVASPSPPVVTAPTQSQFSDAEYWLNSTASQIDPFAAVPNVGGKPAAVRPRVVNGSADLRLSGQTSPHTTTAIATVHHPTSVTTADQQPPSFISTPVRAGEQIPAVCQPGIQTVNASRPLITSSSGVRPVDSQPFDPFDSAFDSAWAAKTSNRSATSMSAPVNNPFQTSVDKVMPAFEVKL